VGSTGGGRWAEEVGGGDVKSLGSLHMETVLQLYVAWSRVKM